MLHMLCHLFLSVALSLCRLVAPNLQASVIILHGCCRCPVGFLPLLLLTAAQLGARGLLDRRSGRSRQRGCQVILHSRQRVCQELRVMQHLL